jgi:hypothetical protein
MAIVHILLESQADVLANDEKGHAPLYEASRQGHLEVVQALLPLSATQQVVSSLCVAGDKSFLDVVHVLLRDMVGRQGNPFCVGDVPSNLAIGVGKVLDPQIDHLDADMEYSPIELSQRESGDWSTPVRDVSLSNTDSRLSTNSFFVQAEAFARKALTYPGSPLYHSMTISAEEAFVAELAHGASRSKADGQRAWDRFPLDETDLATFPNVVDLPCLSGRFLVEENGGQVPFAGLYPRNTAGQVPVQAKEVVVDEKAALKSGFKVATPPTVATADTFSHKAIILDVMTNSSTPVGDLESVAESEMSRPNKKVKLLNKGQERTGGNSTTTNTTSNPGNRLTTPTVSPEENAPIYKLASAIEHLNNPRAFDDSLRLRSSILLHIKRLPVKDAMDEDTTGYDCSHIVKDMTMTVFEAEMEASIGYRIFAGSPEDREAMAMGRVKCWFRVGTGNQMKKPTEFWKRKEMDLATVTANILKKDEDKLSIEVTFEEVFQPKAGEISLF